MSYRLPSITATIVTCNSQRYIGLCLERLLAQRYPELEVVVVDNASTDCTLACLEPFAQQIKLTCNKVNTGFAAGQNQAIAAGSGDWVLALNPDVRMEPGFLERLAAAALRDPAVGTVCGKLLRIGADFKPFPDRRIDSAGLYFTPNLRHFDRGWNEPDDGRYSYEEYVFGASAAAALYRRKMIEDVSLSDGFFDPDFFSYREDADVAWRAQLLGWKCLYTPEAQSYHVRRVIPGTRRGIPEHINMHSVKNRYLMRLKNVTPGLYWRNLASITGRDLLIAGGCLFYEPASLPAWFHFFRAMPSALAKRRDIMGRRRVSDAYMASWFSTEPVTHPAPALAALEPAKSR